jgi:hypothetical protein
MKVGLPTFILTADEPNTVQTYGHENGDSHFHMKNYENSISLRDLSARSFMRADILEEDE